MYLGPAISPSFDKDGVTYQYVVSGLMAYNPNLEPLKRYLLFSHCSERMEDQWTG